jgi:AAA family ATPase
MMAKALATEAGLNFIAIRGPELFSKWVGESEKAIREVFRKARSVAPSIIFFDEIDGLATERGTSSSSGVGDRVLSQLLSELDGIEPLQGVTVIAATNRPDVLDKALVRPGRIDRMIYVGLPDEKARESIFKIKLLKMDHDENDISYDELTNVNNKINIKLSKGYSGAEIVALCTTAAFNTLQEDSNQKIQMKHFISAFDEVKPRTSKKLLEFYQSFSKKN